MRKANPPGRPPELTQEIIDRIIDAIPEVLTQNQIAYRAMILPQRLSDYLIMGNRDRLEGNQNTICAQLADKYYYTRSTILKEKLENLSQCPKNYGAITWILEHCFKDDFEIMSDAHKQLLDWVDNVIKPLLRKQG